MNGLRINSFQIGIGIALLFSFGISIWYLISAQPDTQNTHKPVSATVTGVAATGALAISMHAAKQTTETASTVSGPGLPMQTGEMTESKVPSINVDSAIRQAKADSANLPAPMPPGVTSWQGMTQEQAHKAFESSIREHSRDMTSNPFHSEALKN